MGKLLKFKLPAKPKADDKANDIAKTVRQNFTDVQAKRIKKDLENE